MTSSVQFSSVEFFKHYLSAVDITGTWSWVLYTVYKFQCWSVLNRYKRAKAAIFLSRLEHLKKKKPYFDNRQVRLSVISDWVMTVNKQ